MCKEKICSIDETPEKCGFNQCGICKHYVCKIELKDTVSMMESADYKERFKGEYLQLKIRMMGLGDMLKKYQDGTLTFTPSCSYDLLNGQFKAMDLYASYLEDRAEIEFIDLE